MIGVPLFEHDPELFAAVPHSALPDVREAIVPAWQIEGGAWVPPAIDAARIPFGFVVLKGFLAQETALAEASSIEMLGPGDVLRPWVSPIDAGSDAVVTWEALETSMVAALDMRFASVALRHPAIVATLMDRYASRSVSAALQLAICHIVGLDKRLESMLWHLADRWGRVGREGVILPLQLGHEFLAKLLGVRRPSVTSAVSRLRHEGIVQRRTDGSWLLHGQPPAELAEATGTVVSLAH